MTINKYSAVVLFLLLAGGCNPGKKDTVDRVLLTAMETPAKTGSGEPYLFTDESGKVYLSWIEKTGEVSEFKYSTLQNGTWSSPLLIDSGKNWFVNWADYPMMAVQGKNFMAHYLAKSGPDTYAYDVKITSSVDDGKTWKVPTTLHDDGKQAEHGFVSLLPYKDNFFVAWLDGRNTAMEGAGDHEGHHSQMSLRAAIVDKDGMKLNEWELDNRTCDCCQTSAAITSDGPIVVYRDRSEEEVRDMSVVRLVNDTWTQPEVIHQDNWKIAGCPVNGPRVVARENLVAVAWYTLAENKSRVNVAFSRDGGKSFDVPVQVDEGKAIGRVDVVMLDDQSVMASWMEGTAIKVVQVDADGKRGQPITIATSSEARSSGFPQMTKSGNELLFAWTDDKEKLVKVASLSLQ